MEWRKLNDFPHYLVSDEGKVFSTLKNKLVGSKQKNGYMVVGYKPRVYIHRLVAFAFPEICGEYQEGMQVDHKNTIRDDNRAVNLHWVTPSENNFNPISTKNRSEKLKGKTPWNKGIPLTDECKRKKSEALKGRHWKMIDGIRVWLIPDLFHFHKYLKRVSMNWYDVTLKQFNSLKGIDFTDLEGQIQAAETLLEMNADDLTYVEFAKEVKKLDFLGKKIPEVIIRKSYRLNGTNYECCPNLNSLSVAQYMDFSNLAPTGQLEKILAVFLIPEGKKYGEYDVNKVYEDILTMSIVDVYAVFNFFRMQFKSCIKTLEDYSIKHLKGKKNQVIREAISAGMDSSFMSEL